MEEWWRKSVEHLKEELKFLGINLDYDEVHEIQFLAERKYNRYDQYLPGETFQHRLIEWLNNFDKKDRTVAIQIIKNLVYINRHELRSLTVSTFWNSIRIIQNELSNRNNAKKILQVYLDKVEAETVNALNRSLFIAVSDDVMFDYFRRRAQRRYPMLQPDNFVEYYKLHEKCQKDDLNDLKEIDRIFLIDQLCASGTTFIRKENSDWKGKIIRFFDIWKNLSTHDIYYLPYIISTVAEKNLKRKISEWKCQNKITQLIEVVPTLRIPISVCLSPNPSGPINKNIPVAKLCKKYFKDCIIHEHIKKGGPPTYGFGRAGLALIINTNCPNNSMPVIWCGCDGWFPLFPRIEHHHR